MMTAFPILAGTLTSGFFLYVLVKFHRESKSLNAPKKRFRERSFELEANPEREELKARLTLQIYRLIRERGLTQARAGEVLGIKQPHVSSLMRGQSGSFSVERLMNFLVALGQDVQITVRSTRKRRGEVSVVVA